MIRDDIVNQISACGRKLEDLRQQRVVVQNATPRDQQMLMSLISFSPKQLHILDEEISMTKRVRDRLQELLAEIDKDEDQAV